MLIVSPAFLSRQPSRRIQMTILLVLLWSALPLGINLPAGVMALFCALLAIRFLLIHFRIDRISLPIIILLMLASGILVWQQLGTLVGRTGGIAFLLLMVVLKTYEGNTQRDWQILLLAMLFLMGSGVLLSQSLLTGVWLLSSLFAVGICLAMLGGLPFRQAWRRGGLALLLTLPLMAVLFVVVPRKNEPLWRIPQQQQGLAQTGLSDSMRPGSISQLVQSNEHVANITFNGKPPAKEQMYWRAIIMADFDGTSWRALPDFRQDTAQPRENPAATLHYQMIIRDQNGALPALDYPTGNLPAGTGRRAGDIVRAERSREGLRRLDLQASLSDELPQQLDRPSIRYYSRLPAGNPRTRDLAALLAGQSRNSRDFINRVLAHYRGQGFSYTLQPQRTEGTDSVDRFMFGSKLGFCEHYAESFVVMMRAAGLPARVVTGYLGGEYIANGNFWQLRSKDAHAWAEVWLPEEQVWLRVDPTGAVSEQRISLGVQEALPTDQQAALSRSGAWREWAETGQFYWQQWVVNYDQSRQNSLFAALGLGGFRAGNALLVLALGGGLAALPLVWWWLRMRRQDTHPLHAGLQLIKVTLLGEQDSALPGITPTEMVALMRANGMQDEALEQLLQQYETWCYAADRLPDSRTQWKWLRQVKKALKPYRRQQE